MLIEPQDIANCAYDDCFIWGADGSSPHDQYIVATFPDAPIVRFKPYKFRNRTELEEHLIQRPEWHVKIPGYHIVLLIEVMRWIPRRVWRKIPDEKPEMAVYHDLHEKVEYAAQFYLTHKIQPNEPKYYRNKEST